MKPSNASLPSHYRRIVAPVATSDFRNGTRIETVAMPTPKGSEVVVRASLLGLNASDVNFIAGRYSAGQSAPFYPGFEMMGTVVAKGNEAALEVGDKVAVVGYGMMAEYWLGPSRQCSRVPSLAPSAMGVLVQGITASIALHHVGDMATNQTVLVTAAAGGTGHFAVQLAKLNGNHVIGTCSTPDKADFLKRLGCDRVIDYKKEDLKEVLRKEYPKGIDIVFESVGGDTFNTCVNSLAVRGKLIVIGFVSGYKDQSGWTEGKTPSQTTPLPVKLLAKSSSIRGFFLNNYPEQVKPHTTKLARLIQEGKLISQVDPVPFIGLESVKDAVDHLYSGKNMGKVVVSLDAANSKL